MRVRIKKILKRFLCCYMLYAICYMLMGCAPSPYIKTIVPPTIPGIYHRVERGQTLWRISKMYNVELDEIARINRIEDATNIEVGQLIFIPNRQKPEHLDFRYSSDDFIWPIRGKVITAFGQTFNNLINKGINIQPYSNLDVFASRSGRVIFYADNFGSFGKTIIIDHGDGFLTVYARNAQVFARPGDSVQKGMVIAKTGSAARDKNIYLHFEIRKRHIPQNPYFYLPH